MGTVTARAGLEDERCVDRRQIREFLALTPAERVERPAATVMVRVEILARAGRSRSER